MKVGELAKRTGLSIRTLHYYDEIGLLHPSKLTGSRHRLYGPGELVRLQQIKSLRQLGLSLEEIRECLDSPAFSPRAVLSLHVERLREQIEHQKRLVRLLEALMTGFDGGAVASADELIGAIEAIASIERAFTPAELSEIKARGERLGREHIERAEREWPTLIARVRAEMTRGTAPASKRLRPLAKRWRELVREFTGGNPAIERKVRAMYVNEPTLMKRVGLDSELLAYVNRAIRASDTAQV